MSNSGDAVFRRQITLREALYINTADGSATSGYLYDSSGNFVVRSFTQDKDLIFMGNDGGSTITALTLDMSNAGTALFGGSILTPAAGVIETVSSAGTLTISGGATNKGGKIELSGGNNTGAGLSLIHI